jgi:septal ring factor EnvC (AmiA/AmiB activator)
MLFCTRYRRDELIDYRKQSSSELEKLQNKINEDSLIYRKLTDQITTLEEDLRSVRSELDICDKKVQKCILQELFLCSMKI